jgi:hypothetical protein
MSHLHWSYLNGGYSESVRFRLGARDEGAKNPGQANYDDPGFRVNVSENEQPWRDILNKLGYRFFITFADFPSVVGPGTRFIFVAEIENVGFASMFNPRPVYLVLHNAANSYKFKLLADPRFWRPGGNIIGQAFEIPEHAVPGVYTISMWLPDESPTLQNRPEYAVRFAHDSELWNDEMGYNVLKANGVEIKNFER